jgi:hypothetical protein
LATATNALLDNWVDQGSVGFASNAINYTSVFKVGSTYYLLGNQQNSGIGDIYMYSSTNKTTWSIANGGNPVLHHSVVGSDWNYCLYNTTVQEVGGTLHLLVEGATSTNVTSQGYASSTLPTPNFDTNLTRLLGSGSDITVGAAPDLRYVPDRSAFIAFYMADFNGGVCRIVASTALLSSNLTLAASWVPAANFEFSNATICLGDTFLTDLTGLDKAHNLMLAYNWNQGIAPDGGNWQAYNDLTLDEFYDAITSTADFFRVATNQTRISGREFELFGPDFLDSTLLAPYIQLKGGALYFPMGINANDGTSAFFRIGSGYAKTDTSPRNTFFLGSSERLALNPFGLLVNTTGAAALADRTTDLQTTDYNLTAGGHLTLQAAGGDVGIGPAVPVSKLTVDGAISNGVTTASNSDNRGKITLSAGTGSYTFTQGPGVAGIWTTAPICIIQDDTTMANIATSTKTVTTSTLTITGAVGLTDTYSYICWPGN